MAIIYGSNFADFQGGTSSADEMYGLDGDDRLYAYEGNDLIDGGAGADMMYGGTGSDIYIVNSAFDFVADHWGSTLDIDIVAASDNFSLAEYAGIEYLTVASSTSTYAINLTGTNSNSDHYTHIENIVGNDGQNILEGLGGKDFLNGLGGNDTLDAGSGDDELVGGNGTDQLIGRSGKDLFQFELNGSTDKLMDFLSADDTIKLIAGTGSYHTLAAEQFHIGTASHDADDRIIYNATTGKLFYDPDGLGGAFQTAFATLENHASISAADFLVAF